MFAGMLILAVKFETNTKWAFITYCSVSILSMLITFNIESVMMFVLFFGYYPLLKSYIDKLRFSVARVGLKLIIYNIATITEAFLGFYIFLDGAGTREFVFSFTRFIVSLACNWALGLIVINILTPDDRK
jgi:hypothetical protein